jgi:hypothetical protein
MQNQFDYFGITKSNYFLTDRFLNISQYSIIEPEYVANSAAPFQLAVILSHLNMLRHWYISTNEEYAIFCEDDISFESAYYWNFTWDEFIENLPSDWECVQLMRSIDDFDVALHSLELNLAHGRWWGSHSLMRRSYVKKILDRYFRGYNHYFLEVFTNDKYYDIIVENILFVVPDSHVYNFPMLIENINFNSTYLSGDQTIPAHMVRSHQIIIDLWKTQGSNFDIKRINDPVWY